METQGSKLRALFERAGARFVDVPVLHPADPFLETAGEDIRRRMFVTEGPAGERLALRPDFTIPVCLQHLESGAASGRYAYEGVVFRRHDAGSPERPEAGYEDIGRADRAAADAEALALALSAATEVAPGRLSVRLGDIGLFAALLSALGLPEPWRRRLRRCFGAPDLMEANLDRLSASRELDDSRLDEATWRAAERHDGEGLAALIADRLAAHGHAEGEGRSSAEIAARFLDQRALAEARIEPPALAALRGFLAIRAELAEAPSALAAYAAEHGVDFGPALALFEQRAAALAALAPTAKIRFEANFGRPLDYYTGVVFEVRAEGLAAPLSGGGRYDRLIEMLGGAPQPAVGFMIRLDLAGAGA
jgi:ATP phosphoribosyltransferase regulatory subunit